MGDAEFGLGFRGINPSVAITFDTQQNSEDDDPGFDHISFQQTAIPGNNNANNLAGPLSMEPLYVFNSFGKYFHHLVTIRWDPATTTLSMDIDGTIFMSSIKNLITDVFKGNPKVFWGFTASNTQTIFYPPTNTNVDFGHIGFFFGSNIIPKLAMDPPYDSCLGGPIRFIDSSIYSFGGI